MNKYFDHSGDKRKNSNYLSIQKYLSRLHLKVCIVLKALVFVWIHFHSTDGTVIVVVVADDDSGTNDIRGILLCPIKERLIAG